MDGHTRWTVTGAAAGWALAYYYDAERGARRRALVLDRVTSARAGARDAVDTTRRDARNRLHGLAARGRRIVSLDQADDRLLVERVRERLGRVATHPGAIRVSVEGGAVTLEGEILAPEIDAVLDAVEAVPGVRSVWSMLDIYEDASSIPSLQGRGKLPGTTSWSPTARAAAAGGGALLALRGLLRRGLVGKLELLGGIALGMRGAGNRPVSHMIGLGGGRGVVDVQKTLRIEAPRDEVFSFWRDYENFPRFMRHVKQVRRIDDRRSRWIVDGIGGSNVEFDAVQTKIVDGEIIAWRTEPNALVQHAGEVRFEDAGEGATRVSVRMSYNPPGGFIGHGVATMFAHDPKHQIDDDLLRVKTLLEAGIPARDAAEPQR